MKKPNRQKCGYCGELTKVTKEHVFPSNLYPESKAESRVQRMTTWSCDPCNNGWSDDEAHFRNVLAVSGEITDPVRELWDGPIMRGFHERDGRRRVEDLFNQFVPIVVDGKNRHMIYPGSDERVLRIIKKIVRGLLNHHGLARADQEDIIADIQKHPVPPDLTEILMFDHRELDIVHYRFAPINAVGILSGWIITFYERTTFIAAVREKGIAQETATDS